jgi:hypothetical protein
MTVYLFDCRSNNKRISGEYIQHCSKDRRNACPNCQI